MLTRRVKAYSSSCSQTVSLPPAISSQFILGVCTAAEDRKKINKPPYFGSLRSFKVINIDTTEKLITSACCDMQHAHGDLYRLHERLDNNGKITTFTGVPLFYALMCKSP